jgi:SAM-dependent methyltransferase
MLERDKENCKFTGEKIDPTDKWDIRGYNQAIARYNFSVEYVAGKNVLDIACGNGYGSAFLSKNGCRMVVGADIYMPNIKYAKLHYDNHNTHFICMDGLHLSFRDNCFDAVVSFETIEHVTGPVRFLNEINRILKPGGIFVISTPVLGNSLFLNKDHINEMKREELIRMYNSIFCDVELYGQIEVKPLSITRLLRWKLYRTIKLFDIFQVRKLLIPTVYRNKLIENELENDSVIISSDTGNGRYQHLICIMNKNDF